MKKSFITLCTIILLPAIIAAEEYKGKFSFGYLYQFDNINTSGIYGDEDVIDVSEFSDELGTTYTNLDSTLNPEEGNININDLDFAGKYRTQITEISILQLRGYFDATDIAGKNWGFHFDGFGTYKLTDGMWTGTLNSKESSADIKEFNFEINIPKFDFFVGRKIVTEAGFDSVDGLTVNYTLTPYLYVGALGGMKPNPTNYYLSKDFMTCGVFQKLNLNKFIFTNSVVTDLYKFKPDRIYLFSKVHYKPAYFVDLVYYLYFDMDPAKLTYFYFNTSFRPSFWIKLALSYSRFENIIFKRSNFFNTSAETGQSTLIGDETYDGAYHRAREFQEVHITKNVSLYSSYTYKFREYDEKHSHAGSFGLRDTNFLGYKAQFDTRYTYINNFESVDHIYDIIISKMWFRRLLTETYFQIENNNRDSFNDAENTYGQYIDLNTNLIENEVAFTIGAMLSLDIYAGLSILAKYDFRKSEEILNNDYYDTTFGDFDLFTHSVFCMMTYRI